MAAVIEFETQIAEITSPPEDRRDEEKLYHLMPLSEVQQTAPFVSDFVKNISFSETWHVSIIFNLCHKIIYPLLEKIFPIYLTRISYFILTNNKGNETIYFLLK